jgi:sigma-B regulation protein RsbU (phosphoserine phosphatase)
MGVALLAVAALKPQHRSLGVLGIALGSAMYGIRLLARAPTLHFVTGWSGQPTAWVESVITYTIPAVWTLALSDLLGDWRAPLRMLLWAAVGFALLANLADVVSGRPMSMGTANNVFVLLLVAASLVYVFRHPGPLSPEARVVRVAFLICVAFIIGANLGDWFGAPWMGRAEPVGFAVLLGGLGYAVLGRSIENARQLSLIERELATARGIQQSILPRGTPAVRGLAIAARYVPVASVAGDFYEFLDTGDEGVGVVVADVSGHGIPAALIASMVKVAVAAEAQHARDPGRLLAGVNTAFCGMFRGEFVTAACLHVDARTGRVVYANAGHPPLLVWRRDERRVEVVREHGPLLGHLRGASFPSVELALGRGDRLLIYTDGVIEAMSPEGECFDEERIRALAGEAHALGASPFADRCVASLQHWTGGGLTDDVTLIVIDREASDAVPDRREQPSPNGRTPTF